MKDLYDDYRRVFLLIAGLVLGAGYIAAVHAEEEIWLLVDTRARMIKVKSGNDTRAEFSNISIGQNGAGYDKVQGDYKTPLGIYRIGWTNSGSRFYKFYGITYPSRIDAKRGLDKGLIDRATYRSLVDADLLDQVPSQYTRLGGQIGIHGLGSADQEVHKVANWTRGCIAITNSQIDSLGFWVRKGMFVVIR